MRWNSISGSFAAALLASAAFAQTTWTGAMSSSWSAAGNWSAGVVPTQTVSATITASPVPFLPRIAAGAQARCANLVLHRNLTLDPNANLRVFGTLTVQAGATLSCNGGTTIDTTQVDGNITAFGTIALNAGHTLLYKGDFTVHSNVTGDGTIESNGTTQTLRAMNGASVPRVRGNGAFGGTLVMQDVHARGTFFNGDNNTLDIRGACEVDGTCNVGTFVGDVAASIHVHGTLTIPGNGFSVPHLAPGQIIADGDVLFPNTYNFDAQRGSIVLNGTGPQLINPSTRTEPFDVIVAPGAQVTVNGSSELHGINTLYVQGSLDIVADDTGTPNPQIAQAIVVTPTGHLGYTPSPTAPSDPLIADLVHVEGNLTTTGQGLDIGALNITATGVVALDASDHYVSGDVTVASGGTLSIASGGELVLDGTGTAWGTIAGPVRVAGSYLFAGVAVPGQAVDVGGSLALINGADLALGAGGSLHVAPAGALGLDGTPTDRASVTGQGAAILLEGFLSLRNYEFAGMNTAGVRITQGAVIAPAPTDLRGGLFRGGQHNGAQLDIVRAAPTTLRELDFDSAGTSVAKNVRTTSGAAITIADSLGDHAGPAFETDPGNRVSWLGPGTTATALLAHPRTNRNVLAFATTLEDTASFRFVRDTVPPSAQVALATIPALGAPRSYRHVDDALLAGTTYSYELQRLSPYTGAWRPLGTIARARPHVAQFGNVCCVGPNGFATIPAALAVVPTGGTVFVEAGDYGGFTITRSVRVLGDPLGGTRIVGTTPVVAQNLPVGGTVVLDGLEVRGVEVRLQSLADTAILHEVAITGVGALGLFVDDCPEVALQEVTMTKRADVTRSTLAIWASSLGTVNLLTGTQATHVATTASFQSDGSSSAFARAGIVPRLDAPTLFPVLVPQAFTVTATAGHSYTVFIGLGHDFLDLSVLVPLDMRLLVSLTPGLWTLASGVLGSGGGASFTVTAPDNVSSFGTDWTLQVATFALPTGGRFGEVADFVIVP